MHTIPPRASPINKFAQDIPGCRELVTLTLDESGRRPQRDREKKKSIERDSDVGQEDRGKATPRADITSRPWGGSSNLRL